MKISVLTPVRDRPKALPLCAKWLQAQSMKDFEWIIVDDGDVPVNEDVLSSFANNHPHLKYFKKDPSDVACTYPENLRVATDLVEGEYFTIVEDDDWMGPDYLKDLLVEDQCSVMWNFPAYHLPSGRFTWGEDRLGHCKVVRGPFRRGFIRARSINPHFMIKSEIGLPYLNRGLEKTIRGQRKCMLTRTRKAGRPITIFWESVMNDFSEIHLIQNQQFVGIKGIPGKSISAIHHDEKKIESMPQLDDTKRSSLKVLVGNDAAKDYLSTVK